MSRSKYTSLRKWFQVGPEIGEYIGIRYGHLPPGATEPEWVYYPHTDYDGIGAWAEIMRSRGIELKNLPCIKYYPAYSPVVSALKHWPKYFLPRRPLALKPQERSAVALPEKLGPPKAVAWHVFDPYVTYRLRQDSHLLGLTVNTFLLHCLTRAIRPIFADESVAVPWMIPVNMRGGVHQYRDTDNHTSYVTVNIEPSATPGEIHRRILKALSKGQHWGNWHAFKLANLLTPSMRRAIVRRGYAISQWNIGSFSNLGEWDPDKQFNSPNTAGAWLFCPPALRSQLIAAGCVTFQGRLSVTIQAHPDLTTSAETVRGWVNSWVAWIDHALKQCARLPPWRLSEEEASEYWARM